MSRRHIFAALIAALAATAPAMAAPDDTPAFDLASQRHEAEGVNPVPGRPVKRTDGTTVISPTPRSMTMSDNEFLLISRLKVKAPDDIRYAVPSRPAPLFVKKIKGSKTDLIVEYGAKAADRDSVPDHPEAYRLLIDNRGIFITGRDRLGALHGLATLAQIFKGPYARFSMAPYCDITDWPELGRRGLVEGFYGTPWSHDTRLALIDFLGRNKMNTYIYGPKDDHYHSSPNWRKPYPPEEADKIAELAARARQAGVDFVWAIHPGKDIRWDDADRDSLTAKMEMMYDLGVRGFAVFFDDIEGIGTDPRRQTDLLNHLNRTFVASHPDVAPLSVCPTEYSRAWANPRPGGANDIYGTTLDPDIDVMYTGDAVCSDLTPSTLAFMNGLIRRPAYFWWNFPVSDYCRNFLLQGPAYGLDPSVTAADCAGVLSNPMEHGRASMPALYMLADYAWNPAAYNPLDSWERSLAEVAGKRAAKAYRDFAIHSADTRTGYRRDESWEMPREAFADSIPGRVRMRLAKQFAALRQAPDSLRALATDSALIAELEPWLAQAEALGARLEAALALTAPSFSSKAAPLRWEAISRAIPSPAEKAAYEAHTLGTLRLEPWRRHVVENASRALYTSVAGREPTYVSFGGTYRSLASEEAAAMADGDTATYYHSGANQRPGDRIVIDLGATTPVSEIYLLQGRHEGDTDFFDAFTIALSADGNDWTTVTDAPVTDTYEYRWKGAPVAARYLALSRDDSSARTHWAAIRELAVNPASAEERGLASADPFRLLGPQWLRAIDSDPTTAVDLDGETVELTLPDGAKGLTLLTSGPATDITVGWTDAAGSAIIFTDVATPFAAITAPAGAVKARISGAATINEIIINR